MKPLTKEDFEAIQHKEGITVALWTEIKDAFVAGADIRKGITIMYPDEASGKDQIVLCCNVNYTDTQTKPSDRRHVESLVAGIMAGYVDLTSPDLADGVTSPDTYEELEGNCPFLNGG